MIVPIRPEFRSPALRSVSGIAAIDATNEAGLRLHAGFGFVPAGHFKQAGCKFDRWLDVICLERLLP